MDDCHLVTLSPCPRPRGADMPRFPTRLVLAAITLAALPALADPPVQVKIHEADKLEATEVNLPVDPVQHVRYTYVGNFCYGLYVDNKLLCCGDGAIRPSIRIDNQNHFSP